MTEMTEAERLNRIGLVRRLMAEGKGSVKIAAELGVSTSTARKWMHRAQGKVMEKTRREQIKRYGSRMGDWHL